MGIRLSGLMSNMDVEALVSDLVSAYKYKKSTVEKKQTKLEWKQDAWKSMNTEIYSFYTGSLASAKFQSTYLNMKTTNVSDSSKADVSANGAAANGTQTLEISSIAKASYLTGATLTGVEKDTKLMEGLGMSAGSINVLDNEGKVKGTITIDETTTVSDFVNQLQTEAGLKASYDSKYNRIFINSSSTGGSSNFKFDVSDTATLDNLSKLGLATADNYTDLGKEVPAAKTLGAYQKGTNCVFKLNGADFESETNTNTVNGLTITAKAKTDGEISIRTETDYDSIYNNIKKTLGEFNKLINSMSAAYNAESAGKYEPLTDEEKEKMSDDQIEKWEKKIKDSLLRRDSTLNGVMEAMTTAFSQTLEIEVGGETKKLSLSSFGIQTAGYFVAADNEEKAYHIDGDKDDSLSAMNTDKLMAAIKEDPDTVAKFFSKLTEGVYDALGKKMKSTELSSAYKVYNDKQMESEARDIKKEIDKWEDRIAEYEDYWYKKFTAMEKALANLQSSQSALSGLLGG